MNRDEINQLKELFIEARRNRYLRDYYEEFNSLKEKEILRESYKAERNYRSALTRQENRLECLRVMIDALKNERPNEDGEIHFNSPCCPGNTITLLPYEWKEVITTFIEQVGIDDEWSDIIY